MSWQVAPGEEEGSHSQKLVKIVMFFMSSAILVGPGCYLVVWPIIYSDGHRQFNSGVPGCLPGSADSLLPAHQVLPP